jgi:CHAT domain-containing protein
MRQLEPTAAKLWWSVSEDLFRDWARCCQFLGSPLELVEAIEEARYRCGALARHLLPGRDASSALVNLLPRGFDLTAKPDLVNPFGQGTMLLDYFTVEIMEDRLLCAALSDGADMIFETEISTARGEGTPSTLAALIEANEHWVPARQRRDLAQPLWNRLDDPDAAARMRVAALRSRYPELPNRIHPELDDILLGPIRNQLDGIESIFVAPFNYLHNFPFHALESIQAHLGTGTLEEVVYVPSARLAFEIAARSHRSAERCLFVGYSARNDLPVEEELGLVESRFSRTVGLTGKDATVSNVVRYLGDVDVVHFCCHGRFDGGTDAIYLEVADGGLYAWDLLTAPAFSPQLVFANTCISGVSQRFGTNGDQPLSLPTAALLRGAQNVIGTLWEVRDDVALAFAAQFYNRWLGDEARGAGRAAQATQMGLKQSFEELQLWAAHAVFGGGR